MTDQIETPEIVFPDPMDLCEGIYQSVNASSDKQIKREHVAEVLMTTEMSGAQESGTNRIFLISSLDEDEVTDDHVEECISTLVHEIHHYVLDTVVNVEVSKALDPLCLYVLGRKLMPYARMGPQHGIATLQRKLNDGMYQSEESVH